MKLKQMIKRKADWQVFSLFSCFKPEPGLMPKTARKMLEEIEKTEMAVLMGIHSWVKAEAYIKQMLEEVNASTSIFRYQDTTDFYRDAYKQVFA
jgi:hypothetical protein